MKDYVMIDRQNFFYHPVKNNLRTYENIWKIATGQGDNYTTGCLLDYNYFNKLNKMITIDLSKQQFHNVDPKANTTVFFIIEEAKETKLDFSNGMYLVLM